ncbi:MAG: hypothetical protein K6A82_05060 [Prevotella sp.]|nr:hypothetical protein [Prevotella sp.]
MAKKKTKVMLPGGLAGLAHNVQRGGGEAPATVNREQDESTMTEAAAAGSEVLEQEAAAQAQDEDMAQAAPVEGAQPVQPAAVQAESFTRHAAMRHEPAQTQDGKDRTAPAAKKLPKAEGKQLAREYSIAKDSGEDSWQLFLDLARDYKARDSRLATVYIDSDLKSVLDRLKSATSIKLPSTALLSAIVARFVFDHEKDIKNAIFGESLL